MNDAQLKELAEWVADDPVLHGDGPDITHGPGWLVRETLAQAVIRLLAARDLWRHVAECEQCRGPHDGCDEGQELESACIDDLGFDPYEEN